MDSLIKIIIVIIIIILLTYLLYHAYCHKLLSGGIQIHHVGNIVVSDNNGNVVFDFNNYVDDYHNNIDIYLNEIYTLYGKPYKDIYDTVIFEIKMEMPGLPVRGQVKLSIDNVKYYDGLNMTKINFDMDEFDNDYYHLILPVMTNNIPDRIIINHMNGTVIENLNDMFIYDHVIKRIKIKFIVEPGYACCMVLYN